MGGIIRLGCIEITKVNIELCLALYIIVSVFGIMWPVLHHRGSPEYEM